MPEPAAPPPPYNPVRALIGGVLMGLANLVPGVSGGTMILALGLYDRFIGALADVSRLKLTRASILFLGLVAVGAAAAILSFSGLAVKLVTEERWIMYSLFIGLTLGGAPELVKQCRPFRAPAVLSFLALLAAMLYLAFGLSEGGIGSGPAALVVIGAIAASSMILPGVSGSTMLLIFGVYDVVIGSVRGSALLHDTAESLGVIVPVGIGAALGVALLSNLLKLLLARFPAPSHAALLGLLVGSVAVLAPFQEPVHPKLVDKAFRRSVELLVAGEELSAVNDKYGQELGEADARELRERYAGKSAGDLKQLSEESRWFRPTPLQVGASLGLMVLGFLVTRLLGRKEPLGRKESAGRKEPARA